MVDDDRRAEIEAYEWSLTMALPDATPNDPYDPDEFAEALREVADRIAGEEMPPTGDLWDKRGRLLGHAVLDRVRDARGDDDEVNTDIAVAQIQRAQAEAAARSPQGEDHEAAGEGIASEGGTANPPARNRDALSPARVSQDEDHEAGIEAATTARLEEQRLPTFGPHRPTVERAVRTIVAAYLARVSPPERNTDKEENR